MLKQTMRILSVVLAVMMMFSAFGMAASAAKIPDGYVVNNTEGPNAAISGEVFGLFGDADRDNKITVKDATAIQKYAAGLINFDDVQLVLGDVDQSGIVNVKDATAIQKWVAGLKVDMPINCLIYTAAPATTPGTEPEATTAPATDGKTEATEATGATTATEATNATQATSATEATSVTEATSATESTTAPASDMITVYFTNTKDWDKVYIHYWGGASESSWPGDAMEFVRNSSSGKGVYKAAIPADTTGVVFDAGMDTGNDHQTVNVTELADGNGYYPNEQIKEDGNENYDKWTVTSYVYDDHKDKTSAATEGTSENTSDTITVYFTNTEGWEKVYIHYWGGSSSSEWPGVETTYVRDSASGKAIVKAEIPADTTGIIFGAGKGVPNEQRTVDIKSDIADGMGFYPSSQASDSKWEVTAYEYDVHKDKTTAVTEAASSDEATTAAKPEGTITVYFTNTKDWDKVYVHYWGGSKESSWPGDAMEFVRNSASQKGIYKAEIPVDTTGIIFDAGKGTGNDHQTVDIKSDIADGMGFYPNSQASDEKWEVTAYEYDVHKDKTTAATEAATTAAKPEGTITVYFTNTKDWEKVYVHYWGGSKESSWPGDAMEFVRNSSSGKAIVKAEIPADTTGIIFDAGKGTGNDHQTVDIKSDIADGMGFYPNSQASDEKWEVISYEYDVHKDKTTAATEAASSDEATTAAKPEGTITVYFTNTKDWEKVYVHYWGGSKESSWPGDAMEFVRNSSSQKGIYKAEIPADTTGIIFDAGKDTGNDHQTVDIKSDIADGMGFYPSSQASDDKWEVTAYEYDVHKDKTTAATEAATTATEDEATTAAKPEGNITVYFTNTKDWEKVYVHYWGGSKESSWPGDAMEFVRNSSSGKAIVKAEIPADTTGIIFDAGKGTGNDHQTVDIKSDIADGMGFYPNSQASDEKWEVISYEYDVHKDKTTAATEAATTAATEDEATTAAKPEGTITVYFTNTKDWSKVYVHYWGGSKESSWPGDAMEFVRNSSSQKGIYKAEIPADTTGIIFDAGKDTGNDHQTVDIKSDIADGMGFYPSSQASDDKWEVTAYEYDVHKDKTTAATEADTTTATTATTAAKPEGTITVYFTNTKDWSKVYVHYWGGSKESSWPGDAMEFVRKSSSQKGIYKAEIPADTTGIIFDAGKDTGNDHQTVDIKSDIADGMGFYPSSQASDDKWEVTAYEYDVHKDKTTAATEAGTTAKATEAATTAAATTATEASEPEKDPAKTYYTIGEVNAAASGTDNMTVRGTVTYISGNNAYIEDASGAMVVTFKTVSGVTTKPAAIKVGDYVEATGKKSTLSGMVRFSGVDGGSSAFAILGTKALPSQQVSIAALNADTAGEYKAERILIKGATVSNITATTVTLAQGTATVSVTAPDLTAKISKNDVVDAYVIAKYNNTAYAPLIASADDVTKGSAAEATVTITLSGQKTGWIADAGAIIKLVDTDTNKEYTMVKDATEAKWTASVPETVKKVRFDRCNPDAVTTVWNSWDAGNRGTKTIYMPESSKAGAWIDEIPTVTTVTIYFDNSSTKWTNVYFYQWSDSAFGANKNIAMEKVGTSNIYKLDIPSNITEGLFRGADNWDNKSDQTANVTIDPAKTLFTPGSKDGDGKWVATASAYSK